MCGRCGNLKGAVVIETRCKRDADELATTPLLKLGGRVYSTWKCELDFLTHCHDRLLTLRDKQMGCHLTPKENGEAALLTEILNYARETSRS